MTRLISLLAISLFLFSCGNNANEKSQEQTEAVTHEEHQHHTETNALELNNGKKWKVNDEMVPAIRAMEKDINTFANSEQKDYRSLAEKLQKNIDVLISSCTMKGKAHDELHKWLVPYIDTVKGLKEAKDETTAAKYFGDIQIAFTTFNQYFQ